MDFQVCVEHMRQCLSLSQQLEEFKNYTPSISTGYAYDTSILIDNLKQAVKKDSHCPASFTMCCIRLKDSLQG
jgi:hypothetical protein